MVLLLAIAYPAVITLLYSVVPEPNFILFKPQWDIPHYIEIAKTGYTAFECDGHLCGNIGWLPAWPWLLRFLSFLTAIQIDWLCTRLPTLLCSMAIAFLLSAIELRFGKKKILPAFLFACFFPGAFYFLTGFPYALMLLLISAYFYFDEAKAPFWSNGLKRFFSFLVSITYPTGIVLGVVPLAHYFQRRKKTSLLLDVLPFAVGLGLLLGLHKVLFNNFFIYFEFQKKFGRSFTFPLITLFESFQTLAWNESRNLAIIWHLLSFFVLYSKKAPIQYRVFWISLFLFSLFTGSTEAIYRHYVLLLFPTVMLFAGSNRSLRTKTILIILGFYVSTFHWYKGYISGSLI